MSLLLSLVGSLVAATAPAASGPRIDVSQTLALRSGGQSVTVAGRGFDVEKGIYVAFCVDRGDGARPTPCGGGIDTTGASGGSVWVSSDPPPYGRELAIPYGPDGTFEVELAVSATIGEHDCRKVRCAVVTRSDHTRSDDRGQDVRIPVSFEPERAAPVPTAMALGAAAVGVGAGSVVLAGRRRSRGSWKPRSR